MELVGETADVVSAQTVHVMLSDGRVVILDLRVRDDMPTPDNIKRFRTSIQILDALAADAREMVDFLDLVQSVIDDGAARERLDEDGVYRVYPDGGGDG